MTGRNGIVSPNGAALPQSDDPRKPSYRGFTLLEVLLALALSSVLLGVLAMAIRVQMRATNSGRSDVAQAQLARALFKRIGDDVRGAVWYEQIDPNAMVVPPKSSSMSGAGNSGSGGPSMAGGSGSGSSPSSGSGSGGGSPSGGGSGSGSGSGSGGGSAGGSGGATGAAGTSGTTTTTGATAATTTATTTGATGASGASSASSASGAGGTGGGGGGSGGSGGGGGGGGRGGSSTSVTTTQNLAQAAMMYPPPMMPGLMGGKNWLQVDVSALPRLDQVLGAQMTNQPSQAGATQAADMKTISYFMAAAPGLPQVLATQMADGSRGQGLLRKETGRSMGLMMGGTSAGGATMSTGAATGAAGIAARPEPLAPELVKLEFQYFDGATWQDSWNSQQRNALPKAVKIFASFLAGSMEPTADEIAATDREELVTYQFVVSPAAWRPVPAWATAMQSSGGMSGGTGMSSGTGMSGSGAF